MNHPTKSILGFLEEIGIDVRSGNVSDDSFLPGIQVEAGRLILDLSRLKYPGDLLHEAGHLAVAPSEIRRTMSGEVTTPGDEPSSIELMAMLWSYAACLHLGLSLLVVFHEDGYHGRSKSLLKNFELGVYLGVQGLEQAGMTLSAAEAKRTRRESFPAMLKWLRD